jgi:hypothetical protein
MWYQTPRIRRPYLLTNRVVEAAGQKRQVGGGKVEDQIQNMLSG